MGEELSPVEIRIPLQCEKKHGPNVSETTKKALQGFCYLRKPRLFSLSRISADNMINVFSFQNMASSSPTDQAVALLHIKVCDIADVPTLRGSGGHFEVHWVEGSWLAQGGASEGTIVAKSGRIEEGEPQVGCHRQTVVDETSR